MTIFFTFLKKKEKISVCVVKSKSVEYYNDT